MGRVVSVAVVNLGIPFGCSVSATIPLIFHVIAFISSGRELIVHNGFYIGLCKLLP